MRCPVCPDVDLAIADRQGIEIDYCPKCRGIWLDRGELDKIIERSSTYAESAPERNPERHRHEGDRFRNYENDSRKPYHHGKRKKSFLSEIFDFD